MQTNESNGHRKDYSIFLRLEYIRNIYWYFAVRFIPCCGVNDNLFCNFKY